MIAGISNSYTSMKSNLYIAVWYMYICSVWNYVVVLYYM